MITGKIENRRQCDIYATCEECDFYCKNTENLKIFMKEHDYETTKKALLSVSKDKLTMLGTHPLYYKEWNCMTHYYNPDGIYSERDVHESCSKTTDKDKNCDTCKYVVSKTPFPELYDCNRYYNREARGGFKMGTWAGREDIGTVCDDWEQADK